MIRRKSTDYRIWNARKARYERKGTPGQILVTNRLILLWVEEEHTQDYKVKFDDIVSKALKVTVADTSQQYQIFTPLLALPQSFETVVTILESLPKGAFTLDFVKI